MKWNPLSNEEILKRLALPDTGKKYDMVLDTDTYNEVDDQFALSYSLLSSDHLNVQAVYAAPFFNSRSNGPEQGMERSYDEIVRLLKLMGREAEGFVFKGSRGYLKDFDTPQESPAARDLVARAMARPDDDPLYVLAIGAISNVASALIMEPAIARKIVVVWLAGTPTDHWSASEFNLMQDYYASATMFDCGVPLVLVPAHGVTSHLVTTLAELEYCIGGKNPLCDALVDIVRGYSDDHFAWGKVIWDISTVAFMLNPSVTESKIISSPVLTPDLRWSVDARRHPIREVTYIDRNPVFKDLFTKLAAQKG